MPFTFVRNAAAADDDSLTASVSIALTGIGAGNLLLCWCKWQGLATTLSVSDGASTFTNGSMMDHANGDLHGAVAWLLSANGGNRTITMTLGAARPSKRFHVWEFSYTGGTLALDVQATGSGSSTSPRSGTVTTTGSDAIGFGAYGEYSTQTTSNERIANVAATGVLRNTPAGSWASSWYRTLTATFSNGRASATLASTADWLCPIVVFKISAERHQTRHLRSPVGFF
jgi:hypothetical protein